MKINSNIDFIQTSGGNVLDAHHLEFESLIPEPSPASDTPNVLPSGSIWFDPNNLELRAGETHVERFKYQTVSGVREIRIDEGYSAHNRTSTLAMGTPPEAYTVNFDEFMDDKFYDQSGTDFTIQASGLYRITYNINIQNSSGGGNNDGTNLIECLRNGVTIIQSHGIYYQFSSTSTAGISHSFLTTLDVDDVLTFPFSVVNGGGNSYDWIGLPDNINIEFIRRSDGPNPGRSRNLGGA